MVAQQLVCIRPHFGMQVVDMTKYRFSQLMRPIVILFIPVSMFLALFLQNSILYVICVLPFGALFWFLRCKKCGMSIYYVKQNPYKGLLGRPHKQCTNCGNSFIE
jgi:hypothetical protein